MKFVLSIFLFLCAVTMSAQQTSFDFPGIRRNVASSSLFGTVMGNDGTTLSHVTVRITGLSGIQEVISDETGRFQFGNLQPGTYEVAALNGTSQARQTVVISGGLSEVTLTVDSTPAETKQPGSSVSAQQLRVPEKARRHYEHAMEEVKRRDYEKAMNDVTEALHQFSCYGDALALKAVLELQAGQPASTLADSQKAIQCDGSNAQAYFVLASAYNKLHRPEDAIRTVNEGIRFRPNAWQPYYELGMALSVLQRYSDAVKNLRRAEQLADGSFALIHSMLGYTLFHMGSYSDAAIELRLFLKQEPTGPNAQTVRQALAEVETKLSSANRQQK